MGGGRPCVRNGLSPTSPVTSTLLRHSRTPAATPAPRRRHSCAPLRHSCAGRNPPALLPNSSLPLEGGRSRGEVRWGVEGRACAAAPRPLPPSPLPSSVTPAPPPPFLRPSPSFLRRQEPTRPLPQFIPPPFQGSPAKCAGWRGFGRAGGCGAVGRARRGCFGLDFGLILAVGRRGGASAAAQGARRPGAAGVPGSGGGRQPLETA